VSGDSVAWIVKLVSIGATDGRKRAEGAFLQRIAAERLRLDRSRSAAGCGRGRPVDKDTTIAEQRAALDDLRRRLDQADVDHRQALDLLAAAQERIAALLTDQRAAPPLPARRLWWPWR